MSTERVITIRRNLEQAQHCIAEALSIIEHDEDKRCAVDDLEQAVSLLSEAVIPRLRIELRQKDNPIRPYGDE